jgi:hypothetical protein
MNQRWLFLLSIAIIGILSLSFYLYRNPSLTTNNQKIVIEGNFTAPLNMDEVVSILGSFKTSNLSSSLIFTNQSILNKTPVEIQNSDREISSLPITDIDRNLIDTLSKMVISALRHSNTNLSLQSSSTSSQYSNDLTGQSVAGQWNASILGKRTANFSGLINIQNLIESSSKRYILNLEPMPKEINYLDTGGNLTVIVKGNAKVNIEKTESEVSILLIIHNMKEIYVLVIKNSESIYDNLFVYGKITKRLS